MDSDSIHYQLRFHSKESHPVQTYTHMATPVRWNSKMELERVIIFRVDKKNQSAFITNMKFLIEGHGRKIQVNKVKEIYCKACGVFYDYPKPTGDKICGHCGHNEFKAVS